MLAVQPVLDILVDIDLVNDLIGVVLQGGGEYDNFVEFGHQLDEIHAAGAHQKIAVTPILNIVDQGLIEVEHQGVLALRVALKGWQEGRADLREVLEVVWELSR